MRNRFIVVLAVIAGVHVVGGTFLFVADRWQRPGPAPGAVEANRPTQPPPVAGLSASLARPALVSPVVAPAAAGEVGVHVVGKGDSYWTIAKRYGVSVSALQSANGHSASHVLKTGDRVRIPAKTPPG